MINKLKAFWLALRGPKYPTGRVVYVHDVQRTITNSYLAKGRYQVEWFYFLSGIDTASFSETWIKRNES